MSPPPSTQTPAEIVASANRSRALWLLFAESDPSHRVGQVAATLATAQQGRLSLEGLLEARRGDRIVGASWGQVSPGGTGLLWAAQLTPGESESTALRLHEAIDRWFEQHDVCLAQASLPNKATPAEARLRASGYRRIADVCYMAASLEDSRVTCGEDDFGDGDDERALQFEAYHAGNHQRLADVVEQTYRQTLDCPALDGLRAIDDVLIGHRHTGVFDSQRWLIVRHEQRDIGCLLLADHPQENQWELVYMGIVPEARGKQHGLAVARQAQRLAARAGRERLVLAVDAENAPALAMYQAARFVAWDQRRVFLKVFRRAS
ncbi:MAG: GNAT family N-acetyltransferase [Pirellulaceae bacterium]